MGSEPVYALDEHGNKIVSYVDDTVTPPVTYYEELGVTEEHYSEPIPIEANIAQSQRVRIPQYSLPKRVNTRSQRPALFGMKQSHRLTMTVTRCLVVPTTRF